MSRKTQKPHKGLTKRVKVTATGKVIRHKAGKSHRMYSWSPKRVRRGRKSATCPPCEAIRIRQMLGLC